MRTLHSEIEIEASASEVWKVLADFGAYPVWNPFIRSISGEMEPERTLEVRLEPPGGRAATFNIGDGYDAARLLLENLHGKLVADLGGDFLVAIPARDVFIAFPDQRNAFAHKLNEQVISDFRRMPYPITPKLFLVTRDGVAGGQAAA